MRVLITGSYGYLGTALCQRLAREHEVLAWGRPGAGLPLLSKTKNVVVCPNEDLDAVRDAVGDWDAVAHLAGGGASGGDMTEALKSYEDNVECAVRIARHSKGKQMVLASSHYAAAADTLYGAQKRVAESVWRESGGISLRLAHVYGAGSRVDFGRTGVTEKFARAAACGVDAPVHGGVIDLVHISDACEAFALAIRAPQTSPLLEKIFEPIAIGSGYRIDIRDLWQLFHDGRHRFTVTTHLEYAGATVIGWKPRVDLRDGVAELVEWQISLMSAYLRGVIR